MNLDNLIKGAGLAHAFKPAPAPAPAPAQDDDLLPGDELTVKLTNSAVDGIAMLYGLEAPTNEIEIEVLVVNAKTITFTSDALGNCPITGYHQHDDGKDLITAMQTATPVDRPLYDVFKRLRSQFQAQGYRPTAAEWVRLGIQCRAEGTNNAA